MIIIRRSTVAALAASLVVTALCGSSASAQFNLPGGLDPKRAAVGAVADGVIVGSALIDAYAGSRGAEAARKAGAYAASLRAALPPR